MTETAEVTEEQGTLPEFWKPKKRLTIRHRGERFTPHRTDAVGTITAWSKSSVRFRYDHAPDVEHSMPRHEFNERFAAMLPDPPKQKPRELPKRVGVRYLQDAERIVNAVFGKKAA